MINFVVCSFKYCVAYPFINFCAGDVESAQEVDVLESSSQPVDLSAGKEDQNYGLSEISDCARCSQYSKQVIFLSAF